MLYRIVLFFVLVVVASCKEKTPATPPVPVETSTSFEDVPSGIKKNINHFFEQRKNLGQIYKIVTVSNWEGGPRYTVLSNAGMFMAYINKDNEVAQMWQKNLAGEFIQIY